MLRTLLKGRSSTALTLSRRWKGRPRLPTPSALRPRPDYQAGIALKNDPDDQSALYQEIQAQRRLGNKEAIQPLVSRLEQLKRRQQVVQLKHESDHVAPERGWVRQLVHDDVIDVDRPARRPVEAADQL